MANSRNKTNTFAQGANDLVLQMTRIENKIDSIIIRLNRRTTGILDNGVRGKSQQNIKMRTRFQKWLKDEDYAASTQQLYPTYLSNAAKKLGMTANQFYTTTDLNTINIFRRQVKNLSIGNKKKSDTDSAAKAYRDFLHTLIN